jgi:hypothetical protein
MRPEQSQTGTISFRSYIIYSTIKIENRSEKSSKKPKISVCTLFSNLDKGPVTLLRMRETYEKRMKINAIIFIRTKIL